MSDSALRPQTPPPQPVTHPPRGKGGAAESKQSRTPKSENPGEGTIWGGGSLAPAGTSSAEIWGLSEIAGDERSAAQLACSVTRYSSLPVVQQIPLFGFIVVKQNFPKFLKLFRSKDSLFSSLPPASSPSLPPLALHCLFLCTPDLRTPAQWRCCNG